MFHFNILQIRLYLFCYFSRAIKHCQALLVMLFICYFTSNYHLQHKVEAKQTSNYIDKELARDIRVLIRKSFQSSKYDSYVNASNLSDYSQQEYHMGYDLSDISKDQYFIAWKNTMSMRINRWIKDQQMANMYLLYIWYEANRAGLDPQLVLSVITIESKFQKYAISSRGARGIMQIMPFWTKSVGYKEHNLFDLQTNLRYGCTILRYFIAKEHGNLHNGLARYNGSLGQDKYPRLVINAYKKYWHY